MSRYRRWLTLLSLVFVMCATLMSAPGAAHAAGSGPSDVAPGPKLNGPAHDYKTRAITPDCVTNPDGTCHQSCPVAPSEYNCDGLDPNSSGCTNYTNSTQTIGTTYVSYLPNSTQQVPMDQRYNTVCLTRWTLITAPSGVTICVWIDVQRQVDYVNEPYPNQPNNNDPNSYTTYTCYNNTVVWTNMVYAPHPSPWYSPYNSQPYVISAAGAPNVAPTLSNPI